MYNWWYCLLAYTGRVQLWSPNEVCNLQYGLLVYVCLFCFKCLGMVINIPGKLQIFEAKKVLLKL